MAHLLRIILIHTHLPGVVELELDAHTNICGTNASGKTTLQRLVPVFFGEQPNRVVPKTRKKFDEFYLPSNNSYIVYEYQREQGNICQAVLTRQSGGGVEYRFIDAPYRPELYLLQNEQKQVKGQSYNDWAAALRADSELYVSPKISATSEYRSIIQNDITALRGNNNDSIRLRKLAGSFGLVGHGHKLRHIEKLVSAVHAKEGKMDTLKAMLAAIFEEDGVTLPTTRVKNTKAREWIQQMRQSMRLDNLQQDFEKLSQLARQLDTAESQLAALSPALQQDEELLKQQRADAQQQQQHIQSQLHDSRSLFEQQQTEHNSTLSKAESDLTETQHRLDHLQQQYEQFENRDMAKLQRDTDALPLWRESLQELQEQYQLMVEQHGDMERQLEQQKLKLNEALERLNQQNRAKTRQLQQQKDQRREQQDSLLSNLQQNYQQQLQQQQDNFASRQTELSSQQAVLQARLQSSPLTEQEHEALRIADLRLEQAQQNAQEQNRQLQRLQRDWQQARTERDNADKALETSRKGLRQAEQQLQQLHRQLTPEHGSLRHFLRLHHNGWEQTLGKVIDEQLLERHDLAPALKGDSSTFGGLSLDLSAIALPDYAQDETAIAHRILAAEQQVQQAEQQLQTTEKLLTDKHQAAETLRAQAEQAEWQQTQTEQNIDYARDARNRLQADQQELIRQRQAGLRNELSSAEQALQQLQQEKEHSLSELKSDHQAQILEFKADWQAELQVFDEQIDELERQLDRKREDNKSRIADLQQAFNQELSAKGIDPNTLKNLRSQQQQLNDDIKQVENRQDELRRYQHFMQVDWQQNRPQWLQQETQLKQQQRELQQLLSRLKTDFTTEEKRLTEQKRQWQSAVQQAEQQLLQLAPVLKKLAELHLAHITPAQPEQTADFTERLARANEALEQRNRVDSQLKHQLDQFESALSKDAGTDFLDRLEYERRQLPEFAGKRQQLPILAALLQILRDQQQQLLEQGENIGGDLKKFFTVFSDINRRIAQQSRRLTEAVTDDLVLEGINKSEVRILSTIDELGFWQPLKHFASLYDDWRNSGKALPTDTYLNALADVVELLRSDEQYSIESLLRLELHLNEGGSDLVIKNDRQLLESSSHGMAYLILCKYLLAFTRLLRGEAHVSIHWPIDEIGTLAYHNVEKLFNACSSNNIIVVGAFPNPESDVLMLFKHRYLIEPSQHNPAERQLKRIQPKVSRLAAKLAQQRQQDTPAQQQSPQASAQQEAQP